MTEMTIALYKNEFQMPDDMRIVYSDKYFSCRKLSYVNGVVVTLTVNGGQEFDCRSSVKTIVDDTEYHLDAWRVFSDYRFVFTKDTLSSIIELNKKHKWIGVLIDGVETYPTPTCQRTHNWIWDNAPVEYNLTFRFSDPVVVAGKPGFVECWPDYRSYMRGEKGRRQMKIGKFLKSLCSWVGDADVERLSHTFKDDFTPVEATLKMGEETKDFLHAYTHEYGKARRFIVTVENKYIGDSCMRHRAEFFSHTHHPVEAFATGDFKMVWAEDENGKIVGRSVFCKKTKSCGPVYATCQEGIDVVEQYMKEQGYKYGGFKGAKLANTSGGPHIFGPYFDFGPQYVQRDATDRDILIVSDRGTKHNHHGWYN